MSRSSRTRFAVAQVDTGGAAIFSTSAAYFRLRWNSASPASSISIAAAKGQNQGTLCSCPGCRASTRGSVLMFCCTRERPRSGRPQGAIR